MTSLEALLRNRHVSVSGVAQWLIPNPKLPEGAPHDVAHVFADAAADLLELVGDDTPELTTALRKLLEAKDAAVRACIGTPPR